MNFFLAVPSLFIIRGVKSKDGLLCAEQMISEKKYERQASKERMRGG